MEEKKQIIHLNHKLFREDPDLRFSRRTGLKEGVLNDMWRMYSLNGLGMLFILDWFELKYQRKLPIHTLNDYFNRIKVYNLAKKAIKMGVCDTNIVYFSPHERFVEMEINNHKKHEF